jgi:hypothetical protein
MFKKCRESIMTQTYSNRRHIISIDDAESEEYVKDFNFIRMKKLQMESAPVKVGNVYLNKRPHNLYLNSLMDEVEEGWIIYLDDDDMFSTKDSLGEIARLLKGREDWMAIWRVKFGDKIIPETEYWIKPPVCEHISGIGFCFHSKHKRFAYWDAWAAGDYRVASRLYRIIPNHCWILDILTQAQAGWGGGRRQDVKS